MGQKDKVQKSQGLTSERAEVISETLDKSESYLQMKIMSEMIIGEMTFADHMFVLNRLLDEIEKRRFFYTEKASLGTDESLAKCSSLLCEAFDVGFLTRENCVAFISRLCKFVLTSRHDKMFLIPVFRKACIAFPDIVLERYREMETFLQVTY